MGRFLGEIVGRSPDEIARVRAASRARKDKLLIQEQQNKLAEIAAKGAQDMAATQVGAKNNLDIQGLRNQGSIAEQNLRNAGAVDTANISAKSGLDVQGLRNAGDVDTTNITQQGLNARQSQEIGSKVDAQTTLFGRQQILDAIAAENKKQEQARTLGTEYIKAGGDPGQVKNTFSGVGNPLEGMQALKPAPRAAVYIKPTFDAMGKQLTPGGAFDPNTRTMSPVNIDPTNTDLTDAEIEAADASQLTDEQIKAYKRRKMKANQGLK